MRRRRYALLSSLEVCGLIRQSSLFRFSFVGYDALSILQRQAALQVD